MLFGVKARAEPLRYPDAPRSELVDDYFGTKVADPYRWLEDVDAPQTRAWVAAENALSLPYLAALPERTGLHKRLEQLWNYERFDLPQKRAGKYFFGRNDGLQNQSVLYVQDSADARPRLLLDPNLLSDDGTVALTDYQPSPDGSLLAYATAAAGSDWNVLRVRRVADGVDTGDVLTRVKFSGIAWTRDGKGFFYSRYPAAPPGDGDATFDALANQKLFYHRLGDAQADDPLIAEMPTQPRWLWAGEVTDDGRYLVVSVSPDSGEQNAVWIKDLGGAETPKLDAPFIKLIDNFNADYQLLGNRGSTLYFRTNLDAERGRIVAIDPAKPQPANWRTVVGQQPDTLQSALFAGDEIIALTMHDATSRLQRYTPDGKPLGEIVLPGTGSIPDLSVGGVQLSGHAGDPELFYGYTSFNQPLTPYVYTLDKSSARPFRTVTLSFDPDDYVTEAVFCRSKDGTRIPLFISYRKGTKRNGSNPTMLHAYGGFNIAKMPEFSVPALAWMEGGGVYAQASLRGGSEYGRLWHEAGTLTRKQNVFDDFTAAAQYLIREQWTAPAHLAIRGRSNGGLLIGAEINQHPELFAAALPAVGVMDMLRYQKFTIGSSWAGDYGTSDSASGFRTLYAYSPYHNIRPGTAYPAVLVTTADHDDRVVPGHSFKYAAALQAATSSDGVATGKPVLIRIDANAGHGGGKPIGKLIDEEADKLAFALHFTR
ncbi:S9 family peptidase [Solimonas terrae]|uniref:prolyl oligopeptidase n=2 Tax=Solimonas terrae TaxID=1396819 RepID=A0A6M2BTV4_9GAMM|nr:prolyl oligopeptidase family serine peptidase [Solimonas terrae]NGY05651.1 S9 family peptidase [Solimonas terrae]